MFLNEFKDARSTDLRQHIPMNFYNFEFLNQSHRKAHTFAVPANNGNEVRSTTHAQVCFDFVCFDLFKGKSASVHLHSESRKLSKTSTCHHLSLRIL